jgi:hypothetical protein
MATRDLTATLASALDDETVQPFFAVELLFDSAPIRLPQARAGSPLFERVSEVGLSGRQGLGFRGGLAGQGDCLGA